MLYYYNIYRKYMYKKFKKKLITNGLSKLIM